MLLSVLLAATALLADTTPTAAKAADTAAPPAAAAPAAEAKKADKPKMVCRSEQVTGSIMPKKVCYVAEEQAQRKPDAQTQPH